MSDSIRKMLESLEAAGLVIDSGSGWQPIETAPKDGTPVILAYEGKVGVFNWVEPEKNKRRRIPYPSMWLGYGILSQSEAGEKGDQFKFFASQALAPTHWMPLPAPPK